MSASLTETDTEARSLKVTRRKRRCLRTELISTREDLRFSGPQVTVAHVLTRGHASVVIIPLSLTLCNAGT